jgi:three-Cys-motif partner protein
MTNRRNKELKIDTAHPHTIKKFELIEKYVEPWAQKLLNFPQCEGIVFIDCMCNSGIYKDDDGNEVIGTPIRVANYLHEIMGGYPNKHCFLYFNDLEQAKIEALKERLPDNTNNFHIETRCGDRNVLLTDIGKQLSPNLRYNYLLIYDPYQAAIEWEALFPFLRHWGEVIINHMVFDSTRGVLQATRESTISKYEQTYQATINELVTFGSDIEAYETRIKEIITTLRGTANPKYYIGSFPFFNTKNNIVYNLLHCSGNIEGFKLYKKTAWNVFQGKSSAKKTYGVENQLMLGDVATNDLKTYTDERCYNIFNIAEYLQSVFRGQADVPLDTVWSYLDEHPVFPSEGYKLNIKKLLKSDYSAKISHSAISFK